MPTTVTSTIKSSGGDYTSLSAWEADKQVDLTFTDEIQEAECFAFEDTTAFTIDGWTTSATQYVRVFASAGEGHSGFWDETKFFLSSTDVDLLYIIEEFVRIEGIQFEVTAGGANIQGIRVGRLEVPNLVRIEKCLFKGIISGGGAAACAAVHGDDSADGNCLIELINCVAWDFFITDFPDALVTYGFYNQFSDMRMYNCTTYNCGIGYKVVGTSFKSTAVNCLGYNNEKNTNYIDFSPSTTFQNSSNNGSTDLSAPGTSVQTDMAATDVDLLSETETDSDFLAIDSTSDCVGTGTDDPLSGVYSDDIRGGTRGSTWDIGSDEFVVVVVAAADGIIPILRRRRR